MIEPWNYFIPIYKILDFTAFQADYYYKQQIHFSNTGYYQDPAAFAIDPNRTNADLRFIIRLFTANPTSPRR